MTEVSDYLFNKFIEWEKLQPRRRSSFSAFARYLSDNSLNVIISQPLLEGWINNRYKPGGKYAPVLAEKLGPEVYDYIDVPKPDPLLIYIQSNWSQLSPDIQKSIRDQVAAYLTQGDAIEPRPKPAKS